MCRRTPALTLVLVLSLASCLGVRGAAAEPAPSENLIRDGDFQRDDLRLARGNEPGTWIVYGVTSPDTRVRLESAAGRSGSRGVQYAKTQPAEENVHLDQIVPVAPDTIYEVSAWIRGTPGLKPLLTVTNMRWKPLALAVTTADSQWQQVRLAFHSFDNQQVRLEWFPGATGKLYSTEPGASALDDVVVRRLPNPPPTLRQAFELRRPKSDAEIDRAAVRPGKVGAALPIRPITCRNGVLVYDDGSEVALWGANVQTALSWEYRGRLQPAGVPLTIEALRRVTRENLDQLRQMGANVVRAHLLPGDFSDAEGHVVDTIFLDALDDLLDQCHRRGIYVYLTLVNDMHAHHVADSFMVGHERNQWLFEPELVARMARYCGELLRHANRYNGRVYAADPTIAVVELINEPGYLSAADVLGAAADRPQRVAFDAWCKQHAVTEFCEAHFAAYRHDLVKTVLDQLVEAVRQADCAKPIVWNLNWPQMIGEHEDVFQAVAESRIDAVSFCLYPGQRDVKSPFWAHPADLSGRNYLPYLRQCYQDYRELRWLLGQRFAAKAKVVYEFESMYNHTSHLYPAMARLFRGLGAQMAQMWQYTLTPVAEYGGGSHYLNLYCTPNKAVSFRVAAAAFAAVPRYADYDVQAESEMVFPPVAVSQPRDAALFQADGRLYYSRWTDWNPWPLDRAPREIMGCGSSPWVQYDGSGAYEVQVRGDAIDVTIGPDVKHLQPVWQRLGKAPWQKRCELNWTATHRFTLDLPDWKGPARLMRLEEDHDQPPVTLTDGISFAATPGRYRLERTQKP